MASIFVVAHDGGYEGHSLPYLAFADAETAQQWINSQSEAWSLAEVPIFPALPTAPWFQIKPLR